MDNTNRIVNVKVLFFAKAREVVGKSEVDLSVNCDHSFTLNTFIEVLGNSYPELRELRNNFIIAHNQVYIIDGDENLILNDNDEIAVIPPISGG